ncbi:unnamed protein product [Acanthocheilonema viteae]|uniref:Uncharacterized protein n=1 Tax=Acanthocheilonema viteae TaxID=6277 RepID=A0A498SCA8_ACAVI|nr:unnamed protein product [Acanthocheilonema viteae]
MLIISLVFGDNVAKNSKNGEIKIRMKRQFYGYGTFPGFSVFPFFSIGWGHFDDWDHILGWESPWSYYNCYVWGGHHNRWYSLKSYGYGWGAPWYLFGPRFLIGRRFWKKRWESWSGFHDVWFG